jgi:hypothetical protein
MSRELENVTKLFISSSDDEISAESQLRGQGAALEDDASEVEETVRVQKKIAYPNTRNAQEHMKKCLLDHLQKDYLISRIELKKATDILEPKVRSCRQEEITICLKDAHSP